MFPNQGIYFIFDPLKWKSKPWPENIKKVIPYISAIQLRSPGSGYRSLLETALELKKNLLDTDIPLIINNRIDVAIDSGADGLHLGIDDMPLDKARNIFNGIIGASRHTVSGAIQAEKHNADYIGAGPVFKTYSKIVKRSNIAVAGYKSIRDSVNIPVIPIGGISKSNIAELKGISSIAAVFSAINESSDPVSAVIKIRNIFST
ncbi:thiamine phosphate synthase [Elusimicrobiota bacterium]